jgi:hypothetical protein
MVTYSKLIFIGMVWLLLQSATASASECLLAGTWKSNEEKTLQSMKAVQLTEKQRKLFSNRFFGKLAIDYTCEGFTSTYEDMVKSYKFISMKESGRYVTTEYFEPSQNKNLLDTIEIIDDCYSVPLGKLGFNEVFCKVK